MCVRFVCVCVGYQDCVCVRLSGMCIRLSGMCVLDCQVS